jgi:hypothetical protein
MGAFLAKFLTRKHITAAAAARSKSMFTSLKKLVGGGKAAKRSRGGAKARRGARPDCEALEARELLTLGIGTPPITLVNLTVPSGAQTPAQMRHAYGFDEVPFLQGNYNATASQGETIAIIMGGSNPNIVGDVQTFDKSFGLPDPVLTVVNQTGGSSLPAAGNSQQLGEIALDVEWSHAIAPAAHIVLVECNSMNTGDLFTGVNWAKKQPGVVVVSMSFSADGGFSGEASNNSTFTTPAGHAGVAFVGSSGDNGVFGYPSGSPNVLAVGGTVLTLNSDNTIKSETAWSGSGGGQDPLEPVPSYQQGLGLHNRGTPDLAYSATNYAVFDSSTGGWQVLNGTSCGTPQVAAMVAIIDQGEQTVGRAPLDGPSQLLPQLYKLSADDFNDITTGTNVKGLSASAGYDQVTGRGTPNADRIVEDFVYGFHTDLQGGTLTVNGDQAGVINDGITVGATGSGGVAITQNGRTFTYAPGTVKTLNIDPGQGSNTVTINAVPAGVSVSVNSGYQSKDSVTVGNGSLSAVAGPVLVSNVSGQTNLTIDDSQDTVSRMATVTNSSVQFSGLSPISYQGQITGLTVKGGTGDGYFVNSTASATPLTLVTGLGTNSVYVGNGSLANIASPVNVQANVSGKTTLVVDDFKETGHGAYVTSSSVIFGGESAVSYSNISALDVVGSAGHNTIQVASVPSGVPVTVYNTQYSTVTGAAASSVTKDLGIPIWDLLGISTTRAPGLLG